MDPFGDDDHEGDPFSADLGSPLLFSGLETTEFVGLDDGDEGDAPASPSASQFEALRLDAGPVGTGAGPSTTGGDVEIDDDPFTALEAAIEEDKPKTEPSDEWKRMLEAIEQEEAAGTPDMVPDEAPAAAEDATTTAVVDMDTVDAEGNGEGVHEPPVLLHPDRSPSRVLAQQASDSTASGGGGGGDGDADSHGDDLAGSRGAAAAPPPAASPDPAQSLDELRRASFAALQPVCSRLLQQRSDPGGMGALLEELTHVIKGLDPAGLQACVDYVIFPLQVTLDGIAATRGRGGGDAGAGAALPALRSDRAAEAALAALLALLERARCSKGEQLIGLLHRLSAVVALPRDSAIEEIRLGALKVATAALLPVDRDVALQSALREEDTAPLVGHLSSLVLRAADAELAAGRGGSKAVRAEALRALRALIEAINCPDALSFFLPGLASGLARALLAGGGAVGRARATQGPAASGAAAAQALGALTELLVATLGNAAVGPAVGESLSAHSTGPVASEPWAAVSTSSDALEELILLSKRSAGGGEASIGDGSGVTELPPLPPALAPPAQGEQPRLRVDRTEEWVRASASKIQDMLGTVVPPLATDPRPVVREAAVNTCATLVSECSLALAAARPALADVVFALAQDDWPAVSAAARGWLASSSPASPAASAAPLLLTSAESSLAGWIADLPAVLRKSDEAGRAHALKIVTALESCPPAAITTRLTANAAEASRVVAALAECWELDADSAGLMLLAVPDSGAYGGEGAGGAGEEDGSGDALAPAATLLPRMPMGLKYVSTKQTYAAVAAVVRTLAAAAVAADAAAGPSGGTALRSLVDGCLEHLERLVEAGDAAPGGAGIGRTGRGPGRGMKLRKPSGAEAVAAEGMDDFSSVSGGLGSAPWQLTAAQTVITLTELLFGTSPAWSLLSGLAAAPGAAVDAGKAGAELEALVALVLPEVVDERIWALPTALAPPSSSGNDARDGPFAPVALPSSAPGFTPRDRGSNALLQRAALDCIGTAARALGARFSASGRLLRAILLPALEKLGDPCRIVSSAADSAIASICTHGGYNGAGGGGMRALVAANADYIVDGLCRQLRQPEAHPRAPHLFSALLSHGGVAPGLVPLLAEPAAAALRGVSIVARRRRPEHVLSFVMCLREIARGAGLVAGEAAAKLESLAAEVRGRHEEAVAEKRALMDSLLGDSAASDAGESDKKANIEEIGRFFAEQRAKKEGGDDGDGGDGAASIEHDTKVSVSLDEWNEVLIARRRAVGCATLAQGAVDTLGPLALSTSLPVAVQSLRACCDALDALEAASRGVETCKKGIDPIVSPPGGVLSPTEIEAPALLPSVHLLWSPLIGALGDWRVAVLESVLRVLSHLAGLAGSFLARRFATEAWPLLRRLLAEGPSQRRLIAPGQDDLTSPAVVQRAQRAALACLRDMAAGGEGAAAVVASVAAPAMAAAAELMGDAQPAPVREETMRTFLVLAALDPDAGWALLATALRAAGAAAFPAAPAFPGGDLPPLAAVCPSPPAGAVPKGLRTCGAGKLQALMAQVDALPVPWHTQIEARLAAAAAP